MFLTNFFSMLVSVSSNALRRISTHAFSLSLTKFSPMKNVQTKFVGPQNPSATIYSGGHKPGKHGKPGKLREFEKLSTFQGKLKEGKMKNMYMIANKMHSIEVSSLQFREKFKNVLEISGKTQEI